MKKLLIFFMIFGLFESVNAAYTKLAYDFSFEGIEGKTINLKDYKERVIVIVNVASRCGFTNQYEGLQNLWSNYKSQNLVVIGIPTNNFNQEPGTNKEIKDFCETTFGVDFIMTKKINVKGTNAHSFYKWAEVNYGNSAVPKWNFHKIIINKEGKIANTFSSLTKPSSKKFISFIEKEIKN
jgi:glutathione peroxidase